ncbi:hypothetical protein B0H13DRAFT_758056 [Mycena leptocephala]|nr:hypothetical protein B0H13DRAFT_758056 [Mycena leptocephala]
MILSSITELDSTPSSAVSTTPESIFWASQDPLPPANNNLSQSPSNRSRGFVKGRACILRKTARQQLEFVTADPARSARCAQSQVASMPAQPIPSRMQVPRSTQVCPVRRHRAHTALCHPSYTPHPRVCSHHQPRTAPKYAAHEVVLRDSQSKWRGNPKPTLRMRPAACFIPLPQHSLSSCSS